MSALQRIGSIKVKLGVLVVVSVAVASLVATLGTAAGVPLWLSLPVTVLLALAVTQLLASGMTAPLRDMTEAAQRMARGDYSGRVVTSNTDEVGRLAAAFNQMATDLAGVDAERRDLIATVSHELRTPVAAITAQLDNMVDGIVEPDPTQLAQVLDSAERLGDLVGDLLNLSRLEAGVVELDPVEVVLADLVQECVEEVRAAGRRTEVVATLPAAMRVQADPARMRQLLTNVLDNAARHSPDDGVVRVLAGAGPAGWWLEVLDEGPGVAPQERERVFERFGTDASGGGTGLGLAISRWVARLHGGSLAFLDPVAGHTGARLRLEVPVAGQRPRPAAQVRPVAEEATGPGVRPPAGTARPVAPVSAAHAPSPIDELAGRHWPELRPAGDLRLVGGAVGVGLLAGATMAFSGPGLSWAVVLMAAGLCAWLASERRTSAWTMACSLAAGALVVMLAVRGDAGLTMLGVFVAAGVFLAGLTDARTLRGFLLAGMAWPSSGVRGLPWLGRTLRLRTRRGAHTAALLRTVGLSVLAVVVFGLLFAGADAVFAGWVARLVPSWEFDEAVARGFVSIAVFAMTLAAAYLARNPAHVDAAAVPGRPARNRWEWLVPVVLVDLVFVAFLSTQAAVVLGGHDYVQRTAEMSYGEYVHQGFGQLVVVTLLAFVVIWAAGRHAGPTPSDRAWLLSSVGLLCLLTLGVAATALGRMWIYQDAYGFTVLRVVVIVFEAWLALVVLVVMGLGVRGRTRWVARVALASGTAAVLGLLVVNVDAWVAHRNIDRYEQTGKIDPYYLGQLSGDAAEVVLTRLPQEQASCALSVSDWPGWTSGGSGWTLGRERGEKAAQEFLATDPAPCSEDAYGWSY